MIDVYQQPELTRENQIVATPTLVKHFPLPMRRFIGSLSSIAGPYFTTDLIATGKIAI